MQTTRTINKSYSQLRNLVAKERAAEIDFLKRFYKTDFNEEANFTEILNAINSLLQDEKILKDSLNYIERITTQSGKENQKSSLYSLLNYTIPEKIEKICQDFIENELIIEDKPNNLEDNVEKLSDKLLKELTILLDNELQKEIKSVDLKPFENLYNSLSNQTKNSFIKQIFEGYGLSSNQLLESIKNNINKKGYQSQDKLLKLNHYSTQKKAGNVFEIFSEHLLSEATKKWKVNNKNIKITVQQTGQLNNMKADQILYIGKTSIDLNPLVEAFQQAVFEEGDRSKRIQNIAGLKAMLNNLSQVQDYIIEISDKNYNLTSQAFAKNNRHYGGFAAGNTNLEILQKVLKMTSLQTSNLDNLIFILVNSGDYMINKRNVEDALKLIALNVGSFLFDDVAIKENLNDYKNSSQKLHIFNLNGILVPLSVFLQAAADAFEENQDELENYVKVRFSSSAVKWPNSTGDKTLTKDDWTEFYNNKLKANLITVKFFGDFTNFISKYMKF